LRDSAALLSRVWSIPGRLHPEVTAGVLQRGALANLVVWDTDHPSFWPATDPLSALVMSDTVGAIETMVVAGRARGERGTCATRSRPSTP
jgi:cytosine/adenosine deaminase-related metal-dependent hydrolase